MKRFVATSLAIGVGLVAALGFGMPASAISNTSADLYVLHAVPNTPVDVYVNGAKKLPNFMPGSMAGPLDLPAGTYEIAVTAANSADASKPIIGPASVTLAAGMSYTAVAHLDEAGKPALTAFVNDISAAKAGEGRLTVRHTAAAPAVDILAGGKAVVTGLVNPKEATLNLPAGTISAAVALTGTTAPVIGPADVTIKDGVLTVVYAWGSAADKNLALAVQEIAIPHSNPHGVISGTAGYAAERDQMVQAGWAIGGVGALALGVFALVMVRRSRVES